MSQTPSARAAQLPPAGTLNIDHVAHFVPDRFGCERALRSLGFCPTPFSLQYHRERDDQPLVPVGTGNHCVMLRAGYLEFLAPLADTPVAARLRASITRYTGVHSIVFGTADARADHARLGLAGFEPLAPIDLQRPIDAESAQATARFTVVRVTPEAMPEGRIQLCQHHTVEWVWQQRWLGHTNAACALRGAIVCVEDAAMTAARYARFTGLSHMGGGARWRIDTHRGSVFILEPDALQSDYGVAPPTLPWIAGSVIGSDDLAATDRALREATKERGAREIRVIAPPALGGIFVFVDA